MEFFEQFVMCHRTLWRLPFVGYRFRRLDGQQIIGERRADVVHLAHDKAAKV
jgi:hypothetical protein